jgi:hypothetical protein
MCPRGRKTLRLPRKSRNRPLRPLRLLRPTRRRRRNPRRPMPRSRPPTTAGPAAAEARATEDPEGGLERPSWVRIDPACPSVKRSNRGRARTFPTRSARPPLPVLVTLGPRLRAPRVHRSLRSSGARPQPLRPSRPGRLRSRLIASASAGFRLPSSSQDSSWSRSASPPAPAGYEEPVRGIHPVRGPSVRRPTAGAKRRKRASRVDRIAWWLSSPGDEQRRASKRGHRRIQETLEVPARRGARLSRM